jgi:nucleotide-binding universal stress UspA family protein
VFRTALLAWDGSAEGKKALPPTRRLLAAGGELTVLRVVGEMDQVETARWQIRRLLGDLGWPGGVVREEVAVGDTAGKILEVADARKPDLLVLGTTGREGIDRWRSGSVAETVLRRAGTPVLIVNLEEYDAGHDREAGPLSRVVVPLDGSVRGHAVRPLLLALPGAPGFGLTIVHVPEPGPSTSMPPGSTLPAAHPTGTETRDAVNIAEDVEALEAAGFELEVRTGRGSPAETVLEVLREESPDLAVLWTEGRKGVSRMLVGSVAEAVLRESPVPLLVRHVGDAA